MDHNMTCCCACSFYGDFHHGFELTRVLYSQKASPGKYYLYYLLIYCTIIQATGARLGVLVQSLSSIGAGIVIGFIFSWKLTLVIFLFLPAIGIAGYLEMRMMQGYANAGQHALEEATKVCYIV